MKFHDHLDVCKRCREQPFNLCWLGRQLLAVVERPPSVRLIDVTEQQEPFRRFIIGGVK